jgi:hypothetical protein
VIPRTLFPSGLPTDPRVRKLARRLGVSRAGAVGHLLALWGAVSVHHDGQDVLGVDPEDLAEEALYDGPGERLIDALVEVGLAQLVEGGIRLVGYEDENGPWRRERDLRIANSRKYRRQQAASEATDESGKPDPVADTPANTFANTPSTGTTGTTGEEPPLPPLQGGRPRSQRGPSRRQREAADLLQLGGRREPVQQDPLERRRQDTAIRDSFRQAAERAAAAGDVARAAELNAQADQMDEKFEQTTSHPAAGGGTP